MKIKSQEELKEYYPGKGCQCVAFDETSCCCSNVDWTPTEVYRLRLANSQILHSNLEYSGCPCVHIEPCDSKRCTCHNPLSSWGCLCCCSYGSKEQKQNRARQLKRYIKIGDGTVDVIGGGQ